MEVGLEAQVHYNHVAPLNTVVRVGRTSIIWPHGTRGSLKGEVICV